MPCDWHSSDLRSPVIYAGSDIGHGSRGCVNWCATIVSEVVSRFVAVVATSPFEAPVDTVDIDLSIINVAE